MKVGIVGAGGMAAYHAKGFALAGAEVVAVADANPQKASAFAQQQGIKHTYASLAEMVESEADLEAVSIVTPNKFHAPLTIEALGHGLHVYCEKPPARNAGEMEAMYRAANESGKLLMFGFNNRCRPESRAMVDYLDNGVVGTINSAQATWIRRSGIPGFGGWFTDKQLSGGGPVIDLLHMIDLALYFMGFPQPKCVLASTFNDFMGNPAFKGPWGVADGTGKTDVETACHAMVTFTTGQCLMIRNSWAEMNEREVVSVTFQGTKAGGKVERLFGIDGIDETSTDSAVLFTEEFGRQVNRTILFEKDETMGRVGNAMNFIQALRDGVKPMNTPEQAMILMRITDAIYQSSSTGACVNLVSGGSI
ncbi:MAG: Gfo/Idh/MocA family protein [Sphaerochaeta sp.]|uniref:Gfo/Idh/MocA family protein n=1 Tax=Sphaerochaeta sp. TaxID=1972642 RepID=UPI003D1503D9